jgi:hypothetical protein
MEEATCQGGDDEQGQQIGLGTAAAEGSGGGNLPAVGVHPTAALDASERTEEAGV